MRRKGPVPYPVMVRGVIYASAEECAAALGVSSATVRDAVCRGTTDRIGLGRGNHLNHAKAASKPFSIGGLTWPSMRQASVALGFNRDYIGKVMRGKIPQDALIAAAMDLVARREREAQRELQRAPPAVE